MYQYSSPSLRHLAHIYQREARHMYRRPSKLIHGKLPHGCFSCGSKLLQSEVTVIPNSVYRDATSHVRLLSLVWPFDVERRTWDSLATSRSRYATFGKRTCKRANEGFRGNATTNDLEVVDRSPRALNSAVVNSAARNRRSCLATGTRSYDVVYTFEQWCLLCIVRALICRSGAMPK